MTTLNLNKYPKITAPSDKEEIAALSLGIGGIRDIFENLTTSLEAYVSDISEYDNKARLLEQEKLTLRDDRYDLSIKEKELYKREDEIKKQKEYIANANIAQREYDEKRALDKSYLVEIEAAKTQWEEKKGEAVRQQTIATEKIAKLANLEKRAKELEEREALVNRSEAIDSERKRLLDLREERIKATEARYRIDQQE